MSQWALEVPLGEVVAAAIAVTRSASAEANAGMPREQPPPVAWAEALAVEYTDAVRLFLAEPKLEPVAEYLVSSSVMYESRLYESRGTGPLYTEYQLVITHSRGTLFRVSLFTRSRYGAWWWEVKSSSLRLGGIGSARGKSRTERSACYFLRKYAGLQSCKTDLHRAIFALQVRKAEREAGPVDWRPEETIPEDYYALNPPRRRCGNV